MLLSCAFTAQAFNFEPITQDYTPSGKGANHVFRVANPGTEKIAVKISIRPRSIEPDGTEIQGDESNQFMIYPRQMILNQNESRSIRIKWNGESNPPSELPFRIIAEQVPVSFAEVQPLEGGKITLTYRYEGNIYIVPPDAKPELSIKSIKRENETEIISETVYETEGEKQVEKIIETKVEHEFLVLEIENTGTRHTLLSKIEVKLKRDENDSNPIMLTDDKLKGVAGENMLAGTTRLFRIPIPAGIWEGPVYGSIKQTPVK
jgi:fimbrial chaperone protein